MANEFYTGTEGAIYLGATPAVIVQTKEFSMSIAILVAKQRSKGDAYPSRKSVGRDFSGSLTVHYNPGAAQHVTLLEACAAGTALDVVLYPTGASVGKKITANVIPTKCELSSPDPESTDPITLNIEFEGNGAPVIAAVA